MFIDFSKLHSQIFDIYLPRRAQALARGPRGTGGAVVGSRVCCGSCCGVLQRYGAWGTLVDRQASHQRVTQGVTKPPTTNGSSKESPRRTVIRTVTRARVRIVIGRRGTVTVVMLGRRTPDGSGRPTLARTSWTCTYIEDHVASTSWNRPSFSHFTSSIDFF